MHRAPLVLLLALLAVAAGATAPASARAAEIVGIADQRAEMFANPFFRALDVGHSRLIVSYDAVLSRTFEVAEIDAWMRAARRARVEPLVAFNHARGCYDGEGILRLKRCRLPSVARYAEAFEAFRERYPEVRVYSPWNEINHRSQPTWKDPRRAAEFYNLVRRRCADCQVVAADVLDQRGMADYLRRFQRYAKGSPRLWGLHNYQDANDYKTSGTRRMLRVVPGRIWLTETGGIVKFGARRPYNPRRAARATRYVFKLAGLSRRITRLYLYNWTGQLRCRRFDAGLITPGGRPRPAYYVVRERLRNQRRSRPARPTAPHGAEPPELEPLATVAPQAPC